MQECRIENLFDLNETIAKEIFQNVTYPWEVLLKIADFIEKIGNTLDKNIYEKVGENIWIAKTAKVAKTASITGPVIIDEEAEIRCICGILQAIARITFTKGEIFRPYEFLYTGQTQGIDTKMQSAITGFITVPDSDLGSINTQNGKVDFVEFVGATNAELLAVRNKETDVKTLYEKIGSDVTDYSRKSVI